MNQKEHLEPTYLRYIYDGLIKGSIHPENAAELPVGLIGLYEEAFDDRQPVHKRQQLLERFAIWALLKKEVSAEFVAEVLEQPVEDIQDFISTYSAWFNSPESGKYQLYHERLKVYLLQKLSEKEIHTLHEKLIAPLEQAIKDQNADEFEWYGLEFLAQQYAVSAMLNGNGSKLLTLAYDQNHWQRQIRISKGYNWTKSGLHSVMSWASKYNEDEVIECGLQLVDLHHQEQNAAPQIVELVTEGDFDSALKRIEDFGGNDKDGLQRKFILYMLCLMELTLLDSKDKPFRKEGIEKLLKHLDEHLPVDHSMLNWNDFFPSYLLFQMACHWKNMNINHLSVFRLRNNWNFDWLKIIDSFFDYEFKILIEISDILDSESIGYSEIKSQIALQYLLIDKGENATFFLDQITISEIKSETQKAFCWHLSMKGDIDQAVKHLKNVSDSKIKADTLFIIIPHIQEDIPQFINDLFENSMNQVDLEMLKVKSSTCLYHIARKKESKRMILHSMKFARSIPNHNTLSKFLLIISKELAKQNKPNIARELLFEIYNSTVIKQNVDYNFLGEIIVEMCNQNLNTFKIYLNSFKDRLDVNETYSLIALNFIKKGDILKSTEIINLIEDQNVKNETVAQLALVLLDSKKFQDAHDLAQEITSNRIKYQVLSEIANSLATQESYPLINEILLSINDNTEHLQTCLELSEKAIIYGKNYTLSRKFIMSGLETQRSISGTIWERNELIVGIAKEFVKKKNISYSTFLLHTIRDKPDKSQATNDLCIDLIKEGYVDESIKLSNDISKKMDKIQTEARISTGLKSQGNIERAKLILHNSVTAALKLQGNKKDLALSVIAVEFAKQGYLSQAISTCESIKNSWYQISPYKQIGIALANFGLISESLEIREKIPLIPRVFLSLKIAEVLYHKGEKEESFFIIDDILDLVDDVEDYFWKNEILIELALLFFETNRIKKSEQILSKIDNLAERLLGFQRLAKISLTKKGYFETVRKSEEFISKDSKFFLKLYLNKVMNINLIKTPIILHILKDSELFIHDGESIKHILQLHALNQLFFENTPQEKIYRFNRTLNIQWAIDIKNQLPN